MAPKEPPDRAKIIELLGRSSEQARHAEAYHAAGAAHRTLEGQAAHQAARDAATMLELAGCAEDFVRNRGDPGTTLARLDDALRPVIQMRDAHTHPETGIPAAPITPRVLRTVISHLRTAIGNLDEYTLKIQPPDQGQALNRIMVGIIRMERDGLPDPARLRPRDLHYAEHYRSIQFGRLVKATGLFDNSDKSFRRDDPRYVDINNRIFIVETWRTNSTICAEVPTRASCQQALWRPRRRPAFRAGRFQKRCASCGVNIRHPKRYWTSLTPPKRTRPVNSAGKRYAALRKITRILPATPGRRRVSMTMCSGSRRCWNTDAITEMREALHVAIDPKGDYPALPETVRNHCLYLCFALEKQGDTRLLEILNAADQPQPQTNSAGNFGITDSKAANKPVWPADPEPSIEQGQDRGYKR